MQMRRRYDLICMGERTLQMRYSFLYLQDASYTIYIYIYSNRTPYIVQLQSTCHKLCEIGDIYPCGPIIQRSHWPPSFRPTVSPSSGPLTPFGHRPSRGRVTLFNLQPALRVLPRKSPFLSPFPPYHDLRRFYFYFKILFVFSWRRKGRWYLPFSSWRSPMGGLFPLPPRLLRRGNPLKPPKAFPVPKGGQCP